MDTCATIFKLGISIQWSCFLWNGPLDTQTIEEEGKFPVWQSH